MKIQIRSIPVFLFIGMIIGCSNAKKEVSPEQLKQEIVEAERAFAAMAKSEGIPAAFLAYAADSSVLMRNNTLVKGKKEMAAYFESQPLNNMDISLSWEPAFVDVARSGDLGYTYGSFVFSLTDSTGVTRENTGIFHTVWKRQKDGSWKFVWD